MKKPFPPNKPFSYNPEPKRHIETFHSICPPKESIKLIDFLNDFCKKEKIKIEDIFVSECETMQNSYDGDGTEISLYYKTFEPNTKHTAEYKRYLKELDKYNKELDIYNVAEKKYQEELVEYEIQQARSFLAAAEKKKADAEKEILLLKRKLND